MPMWFIAQICAHLTEAIVNLSTGAEIMCLLTSPQPLRNHIKSFGTLGQCLKIPPICPSNNCLLVEFQYFVLGAYAKFPNPSLLSSGRKVKSTEEIK
jgi:hypothetical protein